MIDMDKRPMEDKSQPGPLDISKMSHDELMTRQRQVNQQIGLIVDDATLRNQVHRMLQTAISPREIADSKRMLVHIYDNVKIMDAHADLPAAEIKAWADYKTKHASDGAAAFQTKEQ